MEENTELDSEFDAEEIPSPSDLWNYMEHYWHNNREFPENTEDLLKRKADLIEGKVPLLQLPPITENDKLADVVERGNTTANSMGFGIDALTYYIGVNTKTLNLRLLNKNPLVEPATGKWNMAVGDSALWSLTTGEMNTAVGGWTGQSLTTGTANLFSGVQAGNKLTTGGYNVMLGYASGFANVSGSENVFVGVGTGYTLKEGSNNVFIGTSAGLGHGRVTNGKWKCNTFLGHFAGSSSTTNATHGNNNVIIGAYAPLGGESNNKLIIHSQTTTSDHNQTIPLIYGDFVARWLSIGGNLRINPLYVEKQSADNLEYDSLAVYNGITGQIGKTPIRDFKKAVRPYKIYSSLLGFNETTFEPQFQVLENSLGNIEWKKTGRGEYEGRLPEVFTKNKTLVVTTMNDFTLKSSCICTDDNTLLLKLANSENDLTDIGGMCGTIEIRTY